LEIPHHAVLKGDIEDLVPPEQSWKFTLDARNASHDCRGMSGAPVLVDDAWVGVVLNTHADEKRVPLFGQMTACRSERIVRACEQADLPVRGGRYGVKPLPVDWKWPEEPFPGLVPLSEDHARMLHGRFRVLRRLLEYVQAPADRLLVVTGR